MENMQAGVCLTQAELERFLSFLAEKGRSPGTIDSYRRCLTLLSRSLPSDKLIGPDTLTSWQETLRKRGYSTATINMCLSVANSFLTFQGRRELQQIQARGTVKREHSPGLTRGEYLRLLQAAKSQGKARTYLLIKLFALTGLQVQEVCKVTVKAVSAGQIAAAANGTNQVLRIPPCLQEELAAFAQHQGITSGPLFCTRNGHPLGRTNVSDSIRSLCQSARVAPEKGNPRCLRRLYLETQRSIQDSLQLLAEQTYDHLLEQEQLSIAWEND